MFSIAEKLNENNQTVFLKKEEIYLSDENVRYEQIGKVIYLMASPSKHHDSIVFEIGRQLGTYLLDKSCKVYPPTLGLDLKAFVPSLKDLDSFKEFFKKKIEADKEDAIYLYPDILVICDNADDNFGYHGYKKVPKMIGEVYSPSTGGRDLGVKKSIYEFIGVEEYWVIHDIRNVSVFLLQNGKYVQKEYQIDIEEQGILEVPVSVFSDFVINFDPRIINW